MAQPKLTDTQRRVMKWLGNRWESEPGNGMAILVNGKRICNVDTMRALQRMGLVEQKIVNGQYGIGQWKATEEGKALSQQLCL